MAQKTLTTEEIAAIADAQDLQNHEDIKAIAAISSVVKVF